MKRGAWGRETEERRPETVERRLEKKFGNLSIWKFENGGDRSWVLGARGFGIREIEDRRMGEGELARRRESVFRWFWA